MFKQKTIYLSLSQSRQWSAEMPIGDPFGGPAAGKRELFGLIGGAISIFSGISAIGAATGIAAIAAGAAIIGGAMTVIGTLTGDAELKNLGGIIGLGGTALSFIGGNGFSEIAKIFGGESTAATAEAAGAAAGTAAATPGADLGVFDVGADLGGGAATLPIETSGFLQPVLPTGGADTLASMEPSVFSGLSAPVSTTGSLLLDTPDITQLGGIGATGATNAGGLLESPGTGITTSSIVAPPAPVAATDSGMLGGISSFLKNNKEMIDMFGGGLKYMSERDKRKADQLLTEASTGSKEAETELLKLKTDILRQQQLAGNTVVNPNLGVNASAGNVGLLSRQMPGNTYQPIGVQA